MNPKVVNVKIKERAAFSYPIIIGDNILAQIGSLIKQNLNAQKLMVITNTTIFKLYGEMVKKSLQKEGFIFDFTVLKDGEKYKNMDSLSKIWDKAIEFRLDRKDAFIALGGGVIGDITGFAAATYLRGIDFVQIPTTLLAQVDSSVGGKVAINHFFGKNLLGAFYQPKLVLADTETLKTLPVKELKTGLAEVLKYGFIEKTCDLNTDKFFSFLKQNKNDIYNLKVSIMSELVEHCCKLKSSVVYQDEKEMGLRAILNLGHTIGHAIEKSTNYEVFTHGEAVAIGLKGVFFLSYNLEKIDENCLDSALELIKDYDLEYKIPRKVTIESIMQSMSYDKKVIASKKRFILPVKEFGVEIFDNIKDEDICSVLSLLY
jgi:3-dehydroquinate synthase